MPVTIDEIDRFSRFAKQAVGHEQRAESLEECLQMWREEQELAETIADVRQGVADIEAGRFSTLEEADRRIRAELGWPPRK